MALMQDSLGSHRAAQISATFSITIFLSLILLQGNQGNVLLMKLLWWSSGFFALSFIRLIDRIFDHKSDLGLLLEVVKVKERALLSLDARWLSRGFVLYVSGWVLFVVSYFLFGCQLYDDGGGEEIKNLYQVWEIISKNNYLISWFCIMAVGLFLSISRSLLFFN